MFLTYVRLRRFSLLVTHYKIQIAGGIPIRTLWLSGEKNGLTLAAKVINK